MKIKLGHGNIAICAKGNKIKYYDAETVPLGTQWEACDVAV